MKKKQLNTEGNLTIDSESVNIASLWQTKVKAVCCLIRFFQDVKIKMEYFPIARSNQCIIPCEAYLLQRH